MKHRASKRFWECYNELPEDIQTLADKNYELLKASPQHPSLHFKKWVIIGQREWGLVTAPWQLKRVMI
jgi:hypothetical protein